MRDSHSAARGRTRSRLRFGLTSLFVAVVAVSLFCGYLAQSLARERKREAALEELHAAGACLATSQAAYDGVYPGDDGQGRVLRDATGFRVAAALGLVQSRHVGFAMFLFHDEPQDDDLRPLKEFPELTSLDISGVGVTDAGIVHLDCLPELRELRLHGTDVTGDGLLRLACPERIRLFAYSTGFTASPNVLSAIERMSELRELSLDGESIETDEIAEFEPPPKLERLILENEDGKLAMAFAGLPRLRYVQIGGEEFDDAAVAKFAKAFDVEELEFGEATMTEKGLTPLIGMASLRKLVLWETVSLAAAQEFSARKPDCEVRHCPIVCGPWGDPTVFVRGERIVQED